jgi:mannonate dehydratase
MDLSLLLDQEPDRRWQLADQMGVTSAVTGLPRTEDRDPWAFEPLMEMQSRFRERGLSLDVIESRPPMDDVVLGREGRDEQIDAVCELLRNMGRLDIPVYCWVWTENPVGVLRTAEVPDRGNAVQTAYDHALSERGPEHPAAADITEAELWENLQYFLDRVVPVAEEAGVTLALHPDDPPVSSARGVPRLVNSVENYERILDMHPSEHHGVCLCQGNFALMEEPVPDAIRRFGDDIAFVHFRDVEGDRERFVETWHDDGPTDMAACIDAYEEVGFEGSARPDHVPVMAGEDGEGNRGRLFAVGYMRGLLD